MPAGLPGATSAENAANPSAGRFVLLDPLSGPKGSPLDRDVTVPYLGAPNGTGFTASGNASTGGLSTGIGYGSPPIINGGASGIFAAGFDDDETPGVTKPDGTAGNSTLLYIGGGRSTSTGASNPYTAGVSLVGAGNGASRDGGAGPAFTGFGLKVVTAAGAVANGAVVETGFVNRSGVALATGQSVIGSASAANAAPS